MDFIRSFEYKSGPGFYVGCSYKTEVIYETIRETVDIWKGIIIQDYFFIHLDGTKEYLYSDREKTTRPKVLCIGGPLNGCKSLESRDDNYRRYNCGQRQSEHPEDTNTPKSVLIYIPDLLPDKYL